MSQSMKVAYSLVLGAWMALLAWGILSLIGYGTIGNVYLRAVVSGGIVGLLAGAAIAALEKYNSTAKIGSTLFGGGIGIVTGFIGGTVGLLVAEFLFQSVPLSGIAQEGLRLIGWGIFGLGVGVGPGLATGSLLKSAWSSAGGCLGGLIGGGVFILLGALFTTFALTASAIGFTLLGLFVGMFIAFGQEVGKQAQLKITEQRIGTKPEEGRLFNVFKKKVSIGKANDDDWIISNDPTIHPHHVEIRQERGNFVLSSKIPGSPAMVRGQPVQVYVLQNDDRFTIGGTDITFRVRKK